MCLAMKQYFGRQIDTSRQLRDVEDRILYRIHEAIVMKFYTIIYKR